MSDFEEQPSLQQNIQELLKRKSELEEKNSSLALRVQDDTEKIKAALKEARKDGRKLLHHREKLRSHASRHLQGSSGTEGSNLNEVKRMEKDYDEHRPEESSPLQVKRANREVPEDISDDHNPVQVCRQLNALRLENAALIKEKRKTEEHNANLVQELADLGIKHEHFKAVCDGLEKENARLSECLGVKSAGNPLMNENQDHIEMMKQQLRLYQEEINGMQAQIEISQRSKEQLRAELIEARALIRDLREELTIKFYRQAPIYQLGKYKTYEDAHGYDKYACRIVRPSYRGFVDPTSKDYCRPRPEQLKKNFFTPDLTAVIDKEVKDGSLVSSKSF